LTPTKKKKEKCPECGCSVNTVNLSRHLNKIHDVACKDWNLDSDTGFSGKDRRGRKAEERKEIMQKRRRMKINIGFFAVLAILIVGGIYLVLFRDEENGNNNRSVQRTFEPEPLENNGIISIPVLSIDSEAKFFSYSTEGKEVVYFAVIGDDGEVHLALDACDVCYHAKEGYTQNGDNMQCVNCGLEFNIDEIGAENKAGGGCWPSYIPFEIQDENIVIESSYLKEKAFMF